MPSMPLWLRNRIASDIAVGSRVDAVMRVAFSSTPIPARDRVGTAQKFSSLVGIKDGVRSGPAHLKNHNGKNDTS